MNSSSYYNPEMRVWLVLFLALLVPLQLSWAATGRYCLHESDAASTHIGHHSHEHQVNDKSESGEDVVKAVSTDMDCGTCHVGCSIAVQTQSIVEKVELPLLAGQWSFAQSNPGPGERPYRPKWDALF